MDPPFGAPGVTVDSYAFGGIAGNAERIRIVGDEATRVFFGKDGGKASLTSAEKEKLAQLVTALAPINRRSATPKGTPDGMSSGLFFAGKGTGTDEGELHKLLFDLGARLAALAPK